MSPRSYHPRSAEPRIDAAEALSAGWVELWYQSKFNTHTLELCGVEALIRRSVGFLMRVSE